MSSDCSGGVAKQQGWSGGRQTTKLARRNETLEEFSALVAHELKTPLQAALVAEDASSALERAVELVDSLIEAGRDPRERQYASAAICLDEALDDLATVGAEATPSPRSGAARSAAGVRIKTPAPKAHGGCPFGQVTRELGAGFDSELAERLAEVVVDGARADEQLRGDFWVGGAVGGEAGDLCFLGCQVVAGLDGWLRACSPVASSSTRASGSIASRWASAQDRSVREARECCGSFMRQES